MLKSLFINIWQTLLQALFPPRAEFEALDNISPTELVSGLTRAGPTTFQNTCALFAYQTTIMKGIIWSIKYKENVHMAKIMANEIYSFIINNLMENRDSALIIPIPVSKKRRNERGYNQCELIVDNIKQYDIHSQFIFENKLLIRRINNPHQTGKHREERLKGADNIFDIDKSVLDKLENTCPTISQTLVIIIDDVITTGSTLSSAMNEIKKAGLNHVFGLALAH